MATTVGASLYAGALDSASATDGPSASVSIASARYTGTGQCIQVPVTLNVSGGVSNGFAYWNTDNETLAGPTSDPTPATFFFDNEDAPGTDSIEMCPSSDQAGSYTYSADVYFTNWDDEGGEQYAGRVTARFTLGLARTKIVKIAKHTWQVKVVGEPYVVRAPFIYLQALRKHVWHTISKGYASNAGKFALKKRPAGRYRIQVHNDLDQGLQGSTSVVFRKP
ncbi:MAG TPA: hypothetical protein VFE15_09925 [Marmoricola sp.]|nr:hypothetical protein [Marmoricola sp.]